MGLTGVWIAILGVVVLALWALLEGMHERLRSIEARLDRIIHLLEGDRGAGPAS